MDEPRLRAKRDQELIEILNELRVALPGAQVLFAFLLILPFEAQWSDTTRAQRISYSIAFLATLLAIVLLIAPSAYHRLRWRERSKERMLRVSNRLALVGLTMLAVAMTAVVHLVAEAVAGTAWAVVLTVGAALAFALAWYALPLSTPYERWDDVEGLDDVGHEETPSVR